MKFDDIVQARERIQPYILFTPLQPAPSFDTDDTRVFLKLECRQRQNAFKVRGALSKITSLTEEEKEKGVYAISSGNHGAGVSYAAHLLGIENVRVYVPETAPESKVEKIRKYGAHVVQVGKNYDETHKAAVDDPAKEGMTYLDPGDDMEVAAGQGTIGLEILEQNPGIDTILVPIGGGGLITGVGLAAKHIKPGIEIIGVQTEACPAAAESLAKKQCFEEYPSEESLCDALVGGMFRLAYDMAARTLDEILVVKESTIGIATARLLAEGVVAEPSGAVGIAALMEYPDRFSGKRAAVVISGGNIDDARVARLTEKYDR